MLRNIPSTSPATAAACRPRCRRRTQCMDRAEHLLGRRPLPLVDLQAAADQLVNLWRALLRHPAEAGSIGEWLHLAASWHPPDKQREGSKRGVADLELRPLMTTAGYSPTPVVATVVAMQGRELSEWPGRRTGGEGGEREGGGRGKGEGGGRRGARTKGGKKERRQAGPPPDVAHAAALGDLPRDDLPEHHPQRVAVHLLATLGLPRQHLRRRPACGARAGGGHIMGQHRKAGQTVFYGSAVSRMSVRTLHWWVVHSAASWQIPQL